MLWFWLQIRGFFTFLFKTLYWGVWSRIWRLVSSWFELAYWIPSSWSLIWSNENRSVSTSIGVWLRYLDFIYLSLLAYLLISSFDFINLQINMCTYILRVRIVRLKIGIQIVRTNVIFKYNHYFNNFFFKWSKN